MKINGNQIKIGNVLEHKGSLFVVTKTQAVKPGKGGAFNQVEMKSIIDNTKLNERFRADEIVERVRIDSESYQYLYSNDILGYTEGHIPRHAKIYRDFKGEFERLQNERVGAFKEFVEDVNNGNFPEETHLVRMQKGELAKFRELLDKI